MCGNSDVAFTQQFLADVRKLVEAQRRERSTVLYDIERAEAELAKRKAELTEVDAGIAEGERVLAELTELGNDNTDEKGTV